MLMKAAAGEASTVACVAEGHVTAVGEEGAWGNVPTTSFPSFALLQFQRKFVELSTSRSSTYTAEENFPFRNKNELDFYLLPRLVLALQLLSF